jgi:hypothetical protein
VQAVPPNVGEPPKPRPEASDPPTSSLGDSLAAEQARLARRSNTPNQPAAGPDEPPATSPAQVPVPARDYGKELAAGLGSPLPCLGQRNPKDAEKTLRIHISAVVMGSGAVSRADVHSAQLKDDERACVKRLAEAVRIPSTSEEGPLQVSTSITLEQAKD